MAKINTKLSQSGGRLDHGARADDASSAPNTPRKQPRGERSIFGNVLSSSISYLLKSKSTTSLQTDSLGDEPPSESEDDAASSAAQSPDDSSRQKPSAEDNDSDGSEQDSASGDPGSGPEGSSEDGSDNEEGSGGSGDSRDEDGSSSSGRSQGASAASGPGESVTQSSLLPADSETVDAGDAAVDAGLLLTFSQHVNDGFPAEEDEGQEPGALSYVGADAPADLMVLEFLSQRILDEVAAIGRLPKGPAAERELGEILQRLGSLAREQTLVRRNHFTPELFLDDALCDAYDSTFSVEWEVARGRVNLATFTLLVFQPQVAVIESVSRLMPNRERLLGSLGFEEAASSFFARVVSETQRVKDPAGAIQLLVDMQTQKWLLAAVDEDHLQSMVAEGRAMSDDSIRELLDAAGAEAANQEAPEFYRTCVASYRSELWQRLDKVSGGRLAITRTQYPLHEVWHKVAQFVSECQASQKRPLVMEHPLISPASADDYQLSGDEPESEPEDEREQGSYTGTEQGGSDGYVSGDVEVTIFQPPKPVRADRSSKDKLADEDVAIDPSFAEERRIAVFLRDAQNDEHMDLLLESISAERIDDSASQLPARVRTPRRMQTRTQRVPSRADRDNEFRLELDDEMPEIREPSSDEEPRRRRGRKRAAGPALDGPEADQGLERLLDTVLQSRRQQPVVHYDERHTHEPEAGKFRGRRGIAAEDPADFAASGRVAFTPSPPGSPVPDTNDAAPASEDDISDMEDDGFEALGQYKPLRLKPSSPAAQAPMPTRARRSTATSPTYGGSGPPRSRKRARRRNVRWTEEEEACFVRAVVMHGPHWARILQFHGVDGTKDHVLQGRTRRNLKDKARNIKLRLLREGRPLGEFEHVTGHL
ncbi:TTAGGG repeat binding factor [Coemansia sp. RSA 552]|nr:TTAGGG repeat binding factor [Coemansia sp. RSA 552]